MIQYQLIYRCQQCGATIYRDYETPIEHIEELRAHLLLDTFGGNIVHDCYPSIFGIANLVGILKKNEKEVKK